MTIAYLNDTFLPLDEARIPAMDRGFLFGDGVYEVFAAYDGKLFGGEQHFLRLENSLKSLRLISPWDKNKLEAIIHELIVKNGSGNQMIYLQITRGPAEKRMLSFPKTATPTLFAYATPFEAPSIEQSSKGIKAITLENTRWRQCRTKAITLLANVLLRQEAADAGCDEAILIEDDHAVEGTSSNLFIVKNNQIFTPALNNHLLGGVTRELLLDICRKEKLDLHEAPITIEQLHQADEIWLTGTTREISPVVELNKKLVANGKSGPMWHTMINHYQHYREALLRE